MGSLEASVATAALVVALVAMLVTTTQLIAQIVATADGTRKCSNSVLGPWHSSTSSNTRTISKKSWREFRLETRFVVPEITLTTSQRWIQLALYDPSVSKEHCKEWKASGEWWEDRESRLAPPTDYACTTAKDRKVRAGLPPLRVFG